MHTRRNVLFLFIVDCYSMDPVVLLHWDRNDLADKYLECVHFQFNHEDHHLSSNVQYS